MWEPWSRALVAALLALLRALSPRKQLEECRVSIQVQGAGSPAARAEVVGRFKGLLQGAFQHATGDRDSDDAPHIDPAQHAENLKAFFFALMGSYPTGEEMAEMLGS